MKKFALLFLILCCPVVFSGCEKESPYLAYLSDLKQNVYTCKAGDVTVTAYYGFREEPFINDGKVGETVFGYTFKLNIIPDDIRRTIELETKDENYSAVFTVDDVTSEYKAFIETKNYFAKEFNAVLVCGSEKTPITMTSILPDNCITYENALDLLFEKQRSLLSVYSNENGFNAEMYMRVFIKNDSPYWYVGVASGNGKLKAFLIDGVSGELLAVREIM